MGAPAPPRAVKNFFFRRNLQGKCASAPPKTRSQSRSQFLGQFLLGGLGLEVYLDVLSGRRLKKGHQLFGKKSAPPDKILATPMGPSAISSPKRRRTTLSATSHVS